MTNLTLCVRPAPFCSSTPPPPLSPSPLFSPQTAAHRAESNAAAVRSEVDRELAALERSCEEARGRIWAQVEQRQMLNLKRFLVEEGPAAPMDLKWLLPPRMSGRNPPLVPSLSNDVRDIRLPSEAEGPALEPCSLEDLASVVRFKVRQWMNLTPSQQLHVVQFRFDTWTPSGATLPVLVWLTAAEEKDEWGQEQALVAIAVDQTALGSTHGGLLQLHWGAAMREGGPQEIVPSGWRTNSASTWESSQGTLATPFTLLDVQRLDIGTLSKVKPRPLVSTYDSEDEEARYVRRRFAPQSNNNNNNNGNNGNSSNGNHGNGSPPRHHRQAHVVLLQLPLSSPALRHGGLAFTLKDAKGRLLNNAKNGHPFFIELLPGLHHSLSYKLAASAAGAEVEEAEAAVGSPSDN